MKPIDNKSLLHFVFSQMTKLEEGKIDTETAKAQSQLAKQAHASLKHEIARANIQMKLARHNLEHKEMVKLRDVETLNYEKFPQ